MESTKVLGFVEILTQALKILFKNGKLLVSIASLTLLFTSLIFLLNVFFISPRITDFIVENSFLLVTNPSSPEFTTLLVGMKQDIQIFLGFQWIFLVANIIITVLSSIALILASAASYQYGANNPSLKELMLISLKSLKGPFITWFYTTLLGVGYMFFVLGILVPAFIMMGSIAFAASSVTSMLLSFLAAASYSYLAMDWTLAVIVSVVEEKYCGIEALEKGKQLVKGMELYGSALNFLFSVLSLVVLQGMRLINFKQSAAVEITIGLIVLNSVCLIRMFWLLVYTSFYYQCKKNHGEEVEMQVNMEYYKAAGHVPLINEIVV
ncbi:hypothetical protein HS088_TW23G00643 [Tripterygium wilfordii]|uniref:Transmembrane protein n=1 Tax=Tripterygium wilfordii TaxID=458696 RepID=A0A7J7BVL3_TRIWF|nr:uncharacterized protein LOC119992716 [Tripterygium wilfordii]KAF5725911.1 hypothetical protein HS088_TW23G00643 [Tripterygium wilfordii]